MEGWKGEVDGWKAEVKCIFVKFLVKPFRMESIGGKQGAPKKQAKRRRSQIVGPLAVSTSPKYRERG